MRRVLIVSLILFTLLALSGPVSAGGIDHEPPPDHGPASIAVGVVAAGIAIVGLSIATRRLRR